MPETPERLTVSPTAERARAIASPVAFDRSREVGAALRPAERNEAAWLPARLPRTPGPASGQTIDE
jgi:hypothetical protein